MMPTLNYGMSRYDYLKGHPPKIYSRIPKGNEVQKAVDAAISGAAAKETAAKSAALKSTLGTVAGLAAVGGAAYLGNKAIQSAKRKHDTQADFTAMAHGKPEKLGKALKAMSRSRAKTTANRILKATSKAK